MSHDGKVRRHVEQACVDCEKDLRAFLLGVLRDVHQVDDAFQRTVVKAIEACDDAQPDSVRGWLFRIALNEARQMRRQQKRQTSLLQQSVWADFQGTGGCDDGLAQTAGLLSDERRRAVGRAITALPADQKEVVLRRVYRGQTFAEIATDLDCPVGTVLTRMRRALRRLKDVPELNDWTED